jgi:NitT/TauT family transport system permease protein
MSVRDGEVRGDRPGEVGAALDPGRPAGVAAARGRIDWVRWAPWIVTVGMFAVWEAAVWLFGVPVYVLPPPTVIGEAMWQFGPALWSNSIQTLWTTLAGFGMAIVFGLALGLAIGWSRFVYAATYPLMVGFNSIPKVAVVPILVLWFGTGEVPAILTAFLISFFPIVVNVATGLATIEPEMEDVLRALGAKKMDIMTKVGIPRAMPYFFGSLKVAITLAFIGSVLSETVAANRGLGHMMLSAQAAFQVPLVFACLIALAILGIGMYALMAWIEMRTTGWAHRSGHNR